MPKKIFVICALFISALAIAFFINTNGAIETMSYNMSVPLPILMYHSVLTDESLSGMYVITPKQLESDIIYLLSRGYNTVSVEQLAAYVERGEELPENPVMLTFDDGCYNNYSYVLPLLEKYEARAVFNIVGEFTDEYSQNGVVNPTYSYMRWTEIYRLYRDPHVEIGNHSYGFHYMVNGRKGAGRKWNEGKDAYKKLFYEDTKLVQDESESITGYKPTVYAYPFGEYTEESEEILHDMGFKASFSCTEGMNHITRDPECLFLLKRWNRPSGISSEEFFKEIGI